MNKIGVALALSGLAVMFGFAVLTAFVDTGVLGILGGLVILGSLLLVAAGSALRSLSQPVTGDETN